MATFHPVAWDHKWQVFREAVGSKLMQIHPVLATSTDHCPSTITACSFCPPPDTAREAWAEPRDHSPLLLGTLYGSTSLRVRVRVLPTPPRPHTIWSVPSALKLLLALLQPPRSSSNTQAQSFPRAFACATFFFHLKYLSPRASDSCLFLIIQDCTETSPAKRGLFQPSVALHRDHI